MIKAEWGAKRSCPKCATRFYDLGEDNPATCIACGHAWVPESVLKSKQVMPFEQLKPGASEAAEPDADADADLGLDADVDDDNVSPDNDVDLGDDSDLGVETGEGNTQDV
ncbi:MAG: TIGR02300 family protein [Sphingopyxis sp.]